MYLLLVARELHELRHHIVQPVLGLDLLHLGVRVRDGLRLRDRDRVRVRVRVRVLDPLHP